MTQGKRSYERMTFLGYHLFFRTFDNDIAILTIDTDVEFKTGIQPICLPSKTPSVQSDKFVKQGVYITGWGATKFRGTVFELHY